MDIVLKESNDPESNDPTLCLNMIVKNESRIIKRLLDSVISIIDAYCICDTGSTDDTVEIIDEYFKNKNIPGKIVREPFKNFCHNRNVALQSCIGLSDYVLLVDADMIVEVNNFNKSSLNKFNSFSVLQGNDSFHYQNMRIVQNNGLYNYVGVTHEYINVPPNNTSTNIDKNIFFIRDVGDGGSKSDKFERDVKLLLDGIKEEPDNVRYHFYLANSYHDSGRFAEAIDVYNKRIKFGGWNQEVWYSYYRIGQCYLKMDKFADALKIWLEGYDYYPDRLEGIYEIIKYYREKSKQKIAMIFYKLAKEIIDKNDNRNHYLFLHNDVYLYKIFYEYTIIASYNGIKNIDDSVITMLNNSSNEDENNNLLSNIKFYKNILQTTSLFNADNSIVSPINGEQIKLLSSSSCLIKNPKTDGYCCNIRYVNYYIEPNGRYINCEKNIITVNKFIEFDHNFNVINENWMDLLFDGRQYIGVEDVKIYYDKYKDAITYIGTGYHEDNKLGLVSGIYDTQVKKMEVNELKQNFKNTYCEKNWVFVDYKNETHVVYEWHPLKICKLVNNELTVVESKPMPKIFSKVRGSTCGFPFFPFLKKMELNSNISPTEMELNSNISPTEMELNSNISPNEIWFIGHIVSYESPRHYYHIISVFDSDMKLLRYSAPFKFEGDPIEYCLSIVVENDRVLINYSTWDRTTRIGIYDKKYIDSIVKYT